jgi:hypothetical protein
MMKKEIAGQVVGCRPCSGDVACDSTNRIPTTQGQTQPVRSALFQASPDSNRGVVSMAVLYNG